MEEKKEVKRRKITKLEVNIKRKDVFR